MNDAVKIVGYKLTRGTCPKWCFAGTSPHDVAAVLKDELDSHEGLSAEECDQIVIEAYETTQDEIDALCDFEGW